MIWKPIMVLAFAILALPREPDLGLGRPPAFPQADLERIHADMLDAIDRVKSDFRIHRGADR